jgi:hypothetical protein
VQIAPYHLGALATEAGGSSQGVQKASTVHVVHPRRAQVSGRGQDGLQELLTLRPRVLGPWARSQVGPALQEESGNSRHMGGSGRSAQEALGEPPRPRDAHSIHSDYLRLGTTIVGGAAAAVGSQLPVGWVKGVDGPHRYHTPPASAWLVTLLSGV